MDLTKVTAVADEPIALSGEDFFTAASYEEADLVVPAAAIKKYAAAPVWKKFLKKWTDSGKLLGDFNNDGKITGPDLVALKAIIAEDDPDLYEEMYDLNGDGKISGPDLVMMKAIIAADVF
jgi:hypothetical protein